MLGVLPAHAFACGITAAELHNLPVPRCLRFETSALLDIGVPAPGRAPRRAGLRCRSLRLVDDDIEVRGGIRVTTVARTWCDLAVTLTVPELVAAGDVALQRVGSSALAIAIERHPDHRPRARLMIAFALLEAASESPKESELRALVVLAGLPRPRVNAQVFDGRGRFVARVDLLFEEYGEVLEYQGDHHRSSTTQWRRDRTRESELEALGHHVTEVTQLDLDLPRSLIERVAMNLRRRGWTGEIMLSKWFPERSRR